jgi:hypothetical protein
LLGVIGPNQVFPGEELRRGRGWHFMANKPLRRGYPAVVGPLES